jgi:hypothetical protein
MANARAVVASLLLALSLAGCTGLTPQPRPNVWLDSPDAVAFESTSWGRLVFDWRLERTGAGTYRTIREVQGGGFHNYDVVTRRFAAGAEGFERIRLLMAEAGRIIDRGASCSGGITDAGEGKLFWERGGQQDWWMLDYGCSTPRRQRISALLSEASTLAEGWANASTTAEEVEQVRRSDIP